MTSNLLQNSSVCVLYPLPSPRGTNWGGGTQSVPRPSLIAAFMHFHGEMVVGVVVLRVEH